MASVTEFCVSVITTCRLDHTLSRFLVTLHLIYRSKPAQSSTKFSSLVKTVAHLDRARLKVFEELFHFQSSSACRIRSHLSWGFKDEKLTYSAKIPPNFHLRNYSPFWSYTSIHNCRKKITSKYCFSHRCIVLTPLTPVKKI